MDIPQFTYSFTTERYFNCFHVLEKASYAVGKYCVKVSVLTYF